MKYPRKYKGENTLAQIPIKTSLNRYRCGLINSDGSVNKITGIADHKTKESCWICCNAYNNRIGYKGKHIKKILKLWRKHGKRSTK